MSNENQIIDSHQSGTPKALPNATAVLVLGILSIVFCWCYGVIGVTLGIIAIVLAGKDRKLYAQNMAAYTEGSYKNMNAGRICAIIGLCLSALMLIYMIWALTVGMAAGMMNWEEIMKNSK